MKEKLNRALFWILPNKVEISNKLVKTFGIFGIFNFSVFFLVQRLYENESYSSSFLRISCIIICIFLVFINYGSLQNKKFKIFYWYFSVFYCLPFFGTYMFIENINSVSWFIKVTLGLLWLALITDWITFLILLPAGILAGWLVHYLMSDPIKINMSIMIEPFINYIWAILIVAIFSRNKQNIEQEKLLAMKTLAGTVAHEMRTPFLGIRANAGCIQKFLPALIDGYTKAKNAQLEVQPLSEKNLQHLVETPDDLDKITTSASLVIDMLLMSLKGKDQTSQIYENCSMRACIAEALREYPLTEEESMLISWENNTDFIFHGNALLMKHVLFNLLKNALYYVKAARKGDIAIWAESTPKGSYTNYKK